MAYNVNDLIREYCTEVANKYRKVAKKYNPQGDWALARTGHRLTLIHLISKVREFMNKHPRIRRRYETLLKMDLTPITYYHKKQTDQKNLAKAEEKIRGAQCYKNTIQNGS